MAAHSQNKTRKPLSRRTLALLFTLLFTFLTMGASFTIAGFTDTGKTSVTMSSGTVSLTLNSAKTYTWNLGSSLVPGSYSNTNVTIRNAGTLPLKYTVATTASGALAPKLTATLVDNGTTTYNGPLSAVNSTPSTLNAGESRTLSLRHTWTPASDDDSFEKTSGNSTLVFTAVQ